MRNLKLSRRTKEVESEKYVKSFFPHVNCSKRTLRYDDGSETEISFEIRIEIFNNQWTDVFDNRWIIAVGQTQDESWVNAANVVKDYTKGLL